MATAVTSQDVRLTGQSSLPTSQNVRLTGQRTVTSQDLALTVTGNEITDATRLAGVQGDSYAYPDSSYGIWETRTNLIANGGFESGTASWGGFANSQLPVPLLTRDTVRAKFGNASMRIDTFGVTIGEGAISSNMTITPSSMYTVSTWVYSTTGGSFRVGIDWKLTNGIYLGGINSVATIPANTWTKITSSGFSFGRATVATVTLYTNNVTPTATTFWVDGVQLELSGATQGVIASANEITDLTRTTSLALTTSSSGQMVDGVGLSVPNWVINPSFKLNIANWQTFGGAGMNGTSVSSWNSTTGRIGNGCLQMVGTPNLATNAYMSAIGVSALTLAGAQATAMPCVSGQVLRVRGSMQVATLASGTPPDLRLCVYYYDNTGANISTSVVQSQATPVVGTWYDLTGTTTAPASVAYAMLRMDAGVITPIPTGVQATILFDAAQICDTTVDPGSYVDGDTAGVVNSAYSWWGTSNASFTRRFIADSSYGIRRAATNLFRRGQCDSVADSWGGLLTGSTVALDSTVVPPFSTQAIKVTTPGTTTGEGVQCSTAAGQAQVETTFGVGSVYFKGNSGAAYQVVMQWRGTDATFTRGTVTSFNATGGWQLLSPAAFGVPVGKTGDVLYIQVFTTTTRAESFWVAHAMLEIGQSVVAPYVATSGGATATITASRVQMSSTVMNGTQGWVSMRVRMGWPATNAPNILPRAFVWQNAGGTDTIRFLFNQSSKVWTLDRFAASIGTSLSSAVQSFNAGDIVTITAAWTSTQLMVSINGGAFVTGSNTNIPTGLPSTLDIGDSQGGFIRMLDSDVLWFATGSGTLTSAQAATIHAIGDTDPTLSTLPSISTTLPQAIWSADFANFLRPGGGVASPYIETSTVAVTRNNARVQMPLNIVDRTTGWAAFRVRPEFTPSTSYTNLPHTRANAASSLASYLFSLSDDTANSNSIQVMYREDSGNFTTRITAGGAGSLGDAITSGIGVTAGTPITVVAYWTPTSWGVSLNGSAFSTITGTLPTFTPTMADLGQSQGGSNFFGEMLWAAFGTGTPTNANAATIHAIGDTDPTFTALPNPTTAIWNADAPVITNQQQAIRLTGEATSAHRSTTNKIYNSGFETNSNFWQSRGGATISLDNSQSHTGVNSLKVITTALNQGASIASTGYMPISPGGTYTASMWVYTDTSGVQVRPYWEEFTFSKIYNGVSHGASGGTTTLSVGVWTKISVTAAVTKSDSLLANTMFQVEAGTANANVWLDDVQFEEGSIATSYIPTNGLPATVITPQFVRLTGERQSSTLSSTITTAGNEVTDATRAAVLTTSSSGQMMDGLLGDSSFGIRRAATNLFRRGQCDAISTDWLAGGSGGVISVTLDPTVPPPFSSQSVKVVIDGANNNQGVYASTSGSWAAGTTLNSSVYFKGMPGRLYKMSLNYFNGATEKTTGPTNFTATGSWQLLTHPSYVVQAGDTATTIRPYVQSTQTGVDTFWVAHAMVETGQVLSSPYVATSGATATHAAGRVQAPSSVLSGNGTQGWFAMRVRMGYASDAPLTQNNVFFNWADSANERLVFDYMRTPTKQWRLARVNGGTFQGVTSATQTFLAGDIVTLVCAWTSSQVKVSVNGGAFVSAAAALSPTLASSLFDIGSAGGPGALVSDSDVLWFATGSGTLNDANAATIHSFANVDPMLGQLPGAPTMAWDAVTTDDTVLAPLVRITGEATLARSNAARLVGEAVASSFAAARVFGEVQVVTPGYGIKMFAEGHAAYTVGVRLFGGRPMSRFAMSEAHVRSGSHWAHVRLPDSIARLR